MISCVAGTLTHHVRTRAATDCTIRCSSHPIVRGPVQESCSAHGDLVSGSMCAFSLLSRRSLCNSTTEEPSIGLLRFIARLSKRVLPNGPTSSEVEGGSAIEGSDVFLVNGQTRSKCQSLFDHSKFLVLIPPQSIPVNSSSMIKCTVRGGRALVWFCNFRGTSPQPTLSP